MSIIYEALKKIEESDGIKPPVKMDMRLRPNKIKIYLPYALVICLGFLIANIIFGLFTRSLQNKPNLAAKDVGGDNKLPNVSLYHALPKEAPYLETPSNAEIASHLPLEVKKELVLNGVFFSQNEGYALVNNQIVKEGDAIEGAIVKRIALDGVDLEKGGSNVKLSTNK